MGVASRIPQRPALKIKKGKLKFRASSVLIFPFLFIRDLVGIRTPNLLGRNEVQYPVMLQGHFFQVANIALLLYFISLERLFLPLPPFRLILF